MPSLRYPMLTSAIFLLSASISAQDEPPRQAPPQGGERLLRQHYLRLTPPTAQAAGDVTFTYGARTATADELARVVRTGARWHVGGDVWPVFRTSHDLRFDGEGEGAPPRASLPAGRYVVTALLGRSRRHLVFTPASAVESRRIAADDPEQLVGIDGVFVPAERIEHDHSTATPAVRLESHEPGGASGSLELQVGSCSFAVDFTLLATATPPAALDAALAANLPKGARHALCDLPDAVEVLTLDPTSRVHDPDGAPRDDATHFRGYAVLGREPLDLAAPAARATATTLQALLRESARAHTDDDVFDCFEPRHGLRIRAAGDTVDLVICFACEQVLVYAGEQQLDGFLVVGTFEPRFSEHCRLLGLPIAK